MKLWWEQQYQDADAKPFGDPSSEIRRVAKRLPQGALVLDVGCGDGRNLLYLAKYGYRVEGFDIDPAALSKVEALASKTNVEVSVWQQDARDFTATKQYDMIVCYGVLHFIHQSESRSVLAQLRESTADGGTNLLAVFTDAVPPPPDMAASLVGLFAEGDLARTYADWQIEYRDDKIYQDEHPGGLRHTHAINKLTAVKPHGLDLTGSSFKEPR